MGKLIFYFFSFLFLPGYHAQAQLLENFDDGDFYQLPQWTGDENAFLVNNDLKLQSNHTNINSTYFLSTYNTLSLSAQWEFFIQLNFNPSSANYVDVYLTASAQNLSAIENEGYFVRIGNADDEISLYRKDATGSIIKIIDGIDDLLNKSNNGVRIKVTRNAGGFWSLSRDINGTGNSYFREGSVEDATYSSSSFFGFLIRQSTASFFQKHYFDDILIKNYEPDVIPPFIQSATALSATQVDVLFNEPVDAETGQVFSNYVASDGLGMPVNATPDPINTSLIHLTFSASLTNGHVYTLLINGIKDITGNEISNASATFSFYTPQQYDIIIDELIADASPQVGLPNREWVELKNISSFPINLKGWRIGGAADTSGAMPHYILQPDSFVIVSTGSAVVDLSSFGKVISVSDFPSLDNDSQMIFLIDAHEKSIHALEYSVEWYKNDLKKEGGWSLEMIDTRNPCTGLANWKASTDVKGGTPGKINSVNETNDDESPPNLLRGFAINETNITLVFDEPLDSSEAAVASNYTIDNSLPVKEATPVAPLFNKVNITLVSPIVIKTAYSVLVKNISDCTGNIIGERNHAKFGIPLEAGSLDLVVNEILFNPLSPGEDYVEIYNRSDKIIDLSKIYLANRNNSNEISSIQQVTSEHLLLFPESFILLTTDIEHLKVQYLTINPDALLNMRSFPSYPDDKGCVILLNLQGNIIDEVSYSEKWHFPLVTNPEGVALERIDYHGPSTQSNFHSAATSAGYGTPGYKNSQFKSTESIAGQIKLSPEVFSPDNDGTDDFLTIDYNFTTPGFVTNITIFNASGRPVRYLQKNSLSGVKGFYRWDGLDDKNRKLPQGIYIIYTEIFNTEGRKKSFKNTVVLARRY